MSSFLLNSQLQSAIKSQTKALVDVRAARWDEAGPLFEAMMGPVKEETAYYRTSKMYITLESWCGRQTAEGAHTEFLKSVWGNRSKLGCLAAAFRAMPASEVPGAIIQYRKNWLQFAEQSLEDSLCRLEGQIRDAGRRAAEVEVKQ